MFAQRFQEDCEDKYERKKIQYGESWKTMSKKELQMRLIEEYDEWRFNKDKSPDIVYGELIDIRNIASMLATRTMEKYQRIKPRRNRLKNEKVNL